MKEKSKQVKFNYPLYDAMPDGMTDITALYLRVSTDSQAQDGYGLDVQYSETERYCRAYAVQNVVVFADDGYTGMNEKRPAFQALKKLMREGRVKFVITHSLDRIGRTQMLILKFLKEDCERAKCDFLAVKDSVDSRSRQTYGILISILSIFAELDHDAIVAKLYMGRKQRAADGFWKGGGNPPYGYYYSRETNNLEPDGEKAVNVKKVFEMYNTREYTPAKIAEILGLSSDVAVFNILRNRTYLGEITFKGEQYAGRHQPLIDGETFEAAQRILNDRKRSKNSSAYLLSSIIYCGVCGAKMRYMKYGKGKDAKLKIICYSHFKSNAKRNLVKDANCDNFIYDASEAENAVVNTVMNFAVKYRDEIKQKLVAGEDILAGLERRAEQMRGEYSRLVKAYGRLGDETVLDEAEKLLREIKRVERDAENEREKREVSKKIDGRAEMLKTLPDVWTRLDGVRRQNIIRGLVKRAELNKGKLKVYLNRDEYDKLVSETDEEDGQ